ncbi:MAG: hypothetical protein JW737_00425 [Acidobacteria bacterium]|nr:hypothetical protein [Acidobacteriota bacterium]
MNFYFITKKDGLTVIKLGEVKNSLKKKSGFLWIDLPAPSGEGIKMLHDELSIDVNLLETALQPYSPNVLETSSGEIAYVIKTVLLNETASSYSIQPVSIFFSPGYIVTVRRGEQPWQSGLVKSIEGKPELVQEDPELLMIRLLLRINEEAKRVVNGWEARLDDIHFEEKEGFENFDIIQYMKIKEASDTLYKEFLDSRAIIEHLAAFNEAKQKKDPFKAAEIERLVYRWEILLEQAFTISQRIKYAIEAFQNLGLKKQRKIMQYIGRSILLFFPVAVILLMVLILFPVLNLETNMTIIWSIAALFAGLSIGALLINLLRF